MKKYQVELTQEELDTLICALPRAEEDYLHQAKNGADDEEHEALLRKEADACDALYSRMTEIDEEEVSPEGAQPLHID